jgi:hypothetical protein
MVGDIRRRLARPVCAILIGSFSFACTQAPSDTPTASDELSRGGTVNPTPATAGDALDGDAITRWCQDLGDQQQDDPAVSLYRRAQGFGDSALAAAATTLSDAGSSSTEAEEAYRTVKEICSDRGVELPDS